MTDEHDEPSDTRARIIREAREHIVEAGVIGFSSREVARRAGLGVASLSHYFPDRQSLIEDALAEMNDELTRHAQGLRDAVWSSATGEAFWSRTMRAAWRFGQEHRELLRAQTLMAVHRGELPARYLENEHILLRVLADGLSRRTGTSRREARFGLRTLVFATARFIFLSDSELEELTGERAGAARDEAIVGQLVRVARALFGDL